MIAPPTGSARPPASATTPFGPKMTCGVARPWMASRSVIAAKAPPTRTARVSCRRRPPTMRPVLAAAAVPQAMAMMTRCCALLIGARSSPAIEWAIAAGTTALAAMSSRFEPMRLRSRRSILRGDRPLDGTLEGFSGSPNGGEAHARRHAALAGRDRPAHAQPPADPPAAPQPPADRQRLCRLAAAEREAPGRRDARAARDADDDAAEVAERLAAIALESGAHVHDAAAAHVEHDAAALGRLAGVGHRVGVGEHGG